MQHSVKLIEYNSPQYHQACQLRYKLFFAEHNLPWNVVLDKNHANYYQTLERFAIAKRAIRCSQT